LIRAIDSVITSPTASSIQVLPRSAKKIKETTLMTLHTAKRLLTGLCILGLSGCSGGGSGGSGNNDGAAGTSAEVFAQAGAFLTKEAQTVGDPVAGREALLSGSYMQCGVPYKVMRIPEVASLVAAQWGNASITDPLPGREGNGAELPYWMNTFVNLDGAEVVNANCLLCHGGKFDGELVLGLANANADFTGGVGGAAIPAFPQSLLDLLGLDVAEQASLDKLLQRAAIIGSSTRMRTVGHNPAETLAVTLMVHHDRNTLAWSDEPYNEFVVRDRDGSIRTEDNTVTSDPAPWWRVKKKNALFYNGMARGDHRGTMALATSVCVDDIPTAEIVDDMFVDIQAFILTVEAPKYQRAIDATLAEEGKTIFGNDCAACHGTYATDAELAAGMEDTYPNLLIPLDVIGTDPVVAEAGVLHSPELVEWYNDSFYGQITQMVPDDPFPGYMPPPLDGIWATAPFLHNGSVPTIDLLLNSSARPAVWKRLSLDTTVFDEEALGWPYVELDYSQQEAPVEEKKFVYDTSYWSQSNVGHTFGDHLSSGERSAVIEYLKTL
jgi:mono/diheme cytochrome c family protein